MKRVLAVAVILFLSFSVRAERENYIILFDCTASMGGSEGGPNVWNQAKEILTQSIININGEDARIIVIPFQDKIGNIMDFPATDKSRINLVLAEVDRMKSSRHRGTSICRAWDVGLKYLEEDALNFMFLLTDGADNISLETGAPAALNRDGSPKTEADAKQLEECTEEVCKRIKRWCDFGPNKIAFYSRLTQNARVEKITEAAARCKNIRFSDGLNIAQLKTREIIINVSDFKSGNAVVKVPLKLTNSLSGKAVVKAESDLFSFTFTGGGFINGSATLTITPKKEYSVLRDEVGNSIFINAVVESEDLENLNIFLNDLTVNVVGSPETVIGVKISNDDLGSARHYRKFLWKKASNPDTLYADVAFMFNEYALAAGAEVKFDLKSDLGDNCEFFVDGQKCKSFEIGEEKTVRLGVVFAPDSPEGVHVIKIVSSDRGVDRIENARLEKGEKWEAMLTSKYKIRKNPLLVVISVVLAVVLAGFVLWMCIGRYKFYPRFKNSLINVAKGNELAIPKRIKGYVKCVITTSSKRQGAVKTFLTGKVLYYQMSPEDGVVSDIVIEPFDKKSVKICPDKNGAYVATLTRLKLDTVGQPSSVSEVFFNQTRKTIKINIQ